MTCSRCGHTVPNITCYVCWEKPLEEPDAFSQAKEARFLDDERSFEFIKDGSNCPDAFIEQQ